MNKASFLQKLRELLSGIPSAEAEEALDYYRDYFADAGEENEAKVIEELGSPEKVAANILRDLGYSDNAGEAKTDDNPGAQDPYPDPYPQQNERRNPYEGREYGNTEGNVGYGYENSYGNTSYGGTSYDASSKQRKGKSHSMAWGIVAIATCWLWGPLLIAMVSALFGVSIGLLAVFFSIGVAALAIIIAAIVLIGAGIVKLFIAPAGGFILLGVGMLLAGIALFGVLLVMLIFGKAIPAIFRGIAWLWRKLFGRGGSAA